MESLRDFCVVRWCTLISGNEKPDLDYWEEEERGDEGEGLMAGVSGEQRW